MNPGFYWVRFPKATDTDWTIGQIDDLGHLYVIGWSPQMSLDGAELLPVLTSFVYTGMDEADEPALERLLGESAQHKTSSPPMLVVNTPTGVVLARVGDVVVRTKDGLRVFMPRKA
jgi:hypothetical protein